MALKDVIAVFTLVLPALIIMSNGAKKNLSREEDLELEKQLKMLNKPAIKTIKTEYGDIFDCVDIYKQPAFDHPLLKNHKLQMRPSFFPNTPKLQEASSMAEMVGLPDGGCPQGYVPIKRAKKEELRNARMFFNNDNGTAMPAGKQPVEAYITALAWHGNEKVYGTKFAANVWGNLIEKDQCSGSLTWVRNECEFINAGWMIHPTMFGDSETRLSIYWTLTRGPLHDAIKQADCYMNTGCFNTFCPGFVQIDTQFPLGTVIKPLSEFKGTQYEIHVDVFKDLSSDGNWWLVINNNKPVGYWPFELFNGLPDHAKMVQWGGYVHGHPGDQVPMGSADHAYEGYGRACFTNRIKLMDNFRAFYDPQKKDVVFSAAQEELSMEEDLELERQLKMLNKPAIKTFETEFGDIFDCVDINKQPAFDNPLLKNHKIQMRPSFLPKASKDEEAPSMAEMIGLPDGGCPQGYVPIRRTNKEALRNAKVNFNYHENETALPTTERNVIADGYKTALIYSGSNNLYGTRFIANVWGLVLERDQCSASTTWIQNECDFLHAGWMSDCYASTGCINTYCPGFVQIDTTIPLGTVLKPVSTYKGTQYSIQVDVFKDLSLENWWLVLDNDKPVGYWPYELFSGLQDHAKVVKWGGYVNAPKGTRTPPMGSGHFTHIFAYGKACFTKGIQLMDNYRAFYYPRNKDTYFTNVQTQKKNEVAAQKYNQNQQWQSVLLTSISISNLFKSCCGIMVVSIRERKRRERRREMRERDERQKERYEGAREMRDRRRDMRERDEGEI
ncbi:hypothetical protein H6P81_017131 [Aristolochia fimbriata]|uniref:Neprosin PEP catalytic domain-containing protein n=1 Tax=Aristolochia fimbriata TaxID=158543 RepID=A0AAV7DXI4_ARIFI|nr:hypothetical protein H6P81_017131 [Aristolochia fimbriata]